MALAATVIAGKFKVTRAVEQAAARRPGLSRLWSVVGTLALIVLFHESHFVLLMLCAVLLYTTACLGLTVQFGFLRCVHLRRRGVLRHWRVLRHSGAGCAYPHPNDLRDRAVRHRGCASSARC